jgi:hypothetical protein
MIGGISFNGFNGFSLGFGVVAYGQIQRKRG